MSRTIIVDRYRSRGLACNPFAHTTNQPSSNGSNTLDLERDSLFVSRQLPPPPAPGSATLVQVIGAKGAGKTTQVQHWRSLTPGPYHYVPNQPYRHRWQRPPVAELVYADEIDRMPALLRLRWLQRLAQREATVVAGTHADLCNVAERAGLAVRTHVLGPVDLSSLRDIVSRRMAAATLPEPGLAQCERPPVVVTEDDLRQIHGACGGSIRAAESLLHQLVAQQLS